ncbi:MAG: Coenzyme F420 hydrogenase/dehydrogenase, beta subunit C-terminal domain [Oscillospiraceae bacterium]|nr:Coenzyme F420 hydrogenase/dehydrogenase, beta subunit C-terminal domain [Oscillospiraceae bacterium]
MNNIDNFARCANCGACYNICPVNAIYVEDTLFYTVKVDTSKCVDCGLCTKVCPVNNPNDAQQLVGAYSAIHNDAAIVRVSSSGGAFTALSEVVLAQGGIVYAAAYGDGCRTVEICSTKETSLQSFQRSKYVESKVGLSFREVKRDLETDRMVLFCGAPCQIAGLKRYLIKDYDNLITCDFSCGGMPSHKLFEQYLDNIECKLGSPIKEVNFRPKTYGWMQYAIRIESQNGKVYNRLSKEDPFLNSFIYSRDIMRDYCYECEFANNHYADITLADFWKFKQLSNVRNGDRGISLLITNSQRGERMVRSLCKKMAITNLDLQSASYNMVRKTLDPKRMQARAEFLEECQQKGFKEATKTRKYPRMWKFRLKYHLYNKWRLNNM